MCVVNDGFGNQILRQLQPNPYHDFASSLRDDRPGLDSCLRVLRKCDVLVVWKLNRLGRNLAHLAHTVQDLSAGGCSLVRARRSTAPPQPAASCSGSSGAGRVRTGADPRTHPGRLKAARA